MRFGQPQQTCAGTPFGLISMGDSETKMGASAGSCNYRPDWPQIVRALYVTPAGGNVGDDGSSNFVTEVGDCRTADGTHGCKIQQLSCRHSSQKSLNKMLMCRLSNSDW